MKLELLASLLGKDATELKGTLNLADGQENVPDEVVQSQIKEFISIEKLNAKQAGISEGKKQAEGMSTRLTMEKVEKRLKELGIEGQNFEEQINWLTTNKNTGKGADVDKKLLEKLDILKVKLETVEKEKNEIYEKFTRKELEKNLQKKLSSVIEKFQFPTDHVKEMAVQEFVNSNKFLENEGDVFLLDIEGKPTAKFEQQALQHFEKWGVKADKANLPPTRENKPGSSGSYGNNLEDLFKSLRNAKTPEEMAAINEKIAVLENAG